MMRRHIHRALAGLLIGLMASSCTGRGQVVGTQHVSPAPRTALAQHAPSGTEVSSAVTLRVLGSSELLDMQPILHEAANATGVTVDFTPIGSVAGATEVIDGDAAGQGYEAVWFASDDYINLYHAGLGSLKGTTQIMASPVILAMRTAVASRLGWDRNPPTWAEIAAAAASKQFTFAMTDPSKSNSGLSVLVAAATEIANTGGALQANEVAQEAPELAGMSRQQMLTKLTSGVLTQAYLQELRNGHAPDGLFDYESQLLTLKDEAPPGDPITLIYPTDGALEATYPLSLLVSARPDTTDAFLRLTAYLLRPPVQQEIMRLTHRRPITGGITLSGKLTGHELYRLPFPGAASTVQYLIDIYNGTPGRG